MYRLFCREYFSAGFVLDLYSVMFSSLCLCSHSSFLPINKGFWFWLYVCMCKTNPTALTLSNCPDTGTNLGGPSTGISPPPWTESNQLSFQSVIRSSCEYDRPPIPFPRLAMAFLLLEGVRLPSGPSCVDSERSRPEPGVPRLSLAMTSRLFLPWYAMWLGMRLLTEPMAPRAVGETGEERWGRASSPGASRSVVTGRGWTNAMAVAYCSCTICVEVGSQVKYIKIAHYHTQTYSKLLLVLKFVLGNTELVHWILYNTCKD